MSYHYAKEIKGQTDGYKQVALKIMCDMIGLPLQHLQSADDASPYCEKPHHTREQCRVRKFDEDLKDKVQTLIPSLKRIYKTQEEILHQGMQKGLRPHQEQMMRSILHTLQGLSIAGSKNIIRGRKWNAKRKHISKTVGGRQAPNLLKTVKIKSLKREIKGFRMGWVGVWSGCGGRLTIFGLVRRVGTFAVVLSTFVLLPRM